MPFQNLHRTILRYARGAGRRGMVGRIGAFNLFRREILLEISLREMMLWLSRAQDATNDDGVSQAYFCRGRRWGASYPETTGYIIPTFFDYAILAGSRAFYDRAVRMADWESTIQLIDGGVQADTVDARTVVPTVFNTGMVIFGWIRAFEETQKRAYLDSARKAGNWLVSVQEGDGAWKRYSSPVTLSSVNSYNTRVAWALLELHRITGDERYLRSARKHLGWALTQQLANGWLENNCLLDNEQPYTHTLAYAMRGFLEAGAYLKDSGYLDAAEKIFVGVQKNMRGDGFLSGRFDRNWRPTVGYCCLTGNAQLALNCFRLYELIGNGTYFEAGKKLLTFVLQTQDLETEDPSIRGAIGGSYPLHGKYHPYQYPNWAAKFTADAVMKWLEIESAGSKQKAGAERRR